MKIKLQEKGNKSLALVLGELKSISRFATVNFFFKFLIIALAAVALIFYGANLQRNQVTASMQQIIFDGMKTNLQVLNNFFHGALSKPDRVFIDVDFQGIQTLNFARNSALEKGLITESEQNISVKGKITIGSETYDVKLSPTGLNLDMIGSIDKRAFKVKVSKGKKIYGMSEFKLLPPSARYKMTEWVGHELEKKEGLIALKYFFVETTLNGKNLGIYAIEEHFNKELLENNQSREGLIFQEKNSPRIKTIKIFNEKKYIEDNAKKNQILLLRSMMEALRKDEVEIERVVDLRKFAKHLAIIELMNTKHAFGGNTFYYFNPITNLIEPIAREYNSLRYSDGPPNPNNFVTSLFVKEAEDYLFFGKLLKNREFIKYYLDALARLSSEEYLKAFFEETISEFNVQQNIIFKEYPFYKFPKEYLFLRQTQIKDWLNKELDLIVNVDTNENNDKEIKITNRSIFPIYISDLDNGNSHIKDINYVLNPTDEIDIYLESSSLGSDDDLKITYKIHGIINDERKASAIPKSFNSALSFPQLWNDLSFYSHPGIIIEKDSMNVYFKDNFIEIDNDIFIPENFTVIGGPGLKINLLNGASLFSRSPFIFSGTKDNNIVVTSSDGLGGGIALYSTKFKNIFKNVRFELLRSPNIDLSGLTASISIYDSIVDFENTIFSDNEAEDFLNLIQSQYAISNSYFIDVKSDALDSDFSTGEINNTSFIDIGNDAVDFSGSFAELEKIEIRQVGDKAISVGENSNIAGNYINISDVEIGITSKDLSFLNLDNVKIFNTRLGFAIFKKKEEFGGGFASVSNLEKNNVELDYLVDVNSELLINGEQISNKERDVNGLLYGKLYGKSSK